MGEGDGVKAEGQVGDLEDRPGWPIPRASEDDLALFAPVDKDARAAESRASWAPQPESAAAVVPLGGDTGGRAGIPRI